MRVSCVELFGLHPAIFQGAELRGPSVYMLDRSKSVLNPYAGCSWFPVLWCSPTITGASHFEEPRRQIAILNTSSAACICHDGSSLYGHVR